MTVDDRELAAIEASAQRVANWPEPDRQAMIQAARETIDSYFHEGRINEEIRDRLYQILSNPSHEA